MLLHQKKIVGQAQFAYNHSEQEIYPYDSEEALYPAYNLAETIELMPKPFEVFGYTYDFKIQKGDNAWLLSLTNSQASADDIPFQSYSQNPAEEAAKILLLFKDYQSQVDDSQFLMKLYKVMNSQ